MNRMNRNQFFIIGAALVLIALLFSLSLRIIGPSIGLFGLADTRGSEQENAGKSGGENKGNAEQAEVKAGLSFTTLQKTELRASVAEKTAVPECPEETEIGITIENVGPSDAEKVFILFGKAVKVIACNNCRVDELQPRQSVLAKARLCRETRETNEITIGSANSNSVNLDLNQ